MSRVIPRVTPFCAIPAVRTATLGAAAPARMRLAVAAAAALLALCASALAQTPQQAAETFPNRAVRIIVPFPAGGPTDVGARIVAQRLSEVWKQPVVIENRPGGNTVIGAVQVAKADPDGYTLLAAMDTTLVMNTATATAPVPYDPLKDFASIGMTAKNTTLLVVRAADGPKTIAELIARGKAANGKMTYGAGIIPTRLAGYLFAKSAGFDAQLIPYRGSSEVVQGLSTKSVDFIVDGVTSSLALIQGGQFRALAKLDDSPLPTLPDVPALSVAAGLPGLEDMSTWVALVAPAGTPPAILDKIQREVAKASSDPAIVERLEAAGIKPKVSTPAELDAYVRSELARWTAVFKDSGLKMD